MIEMKRTQYRVLITLCMALLLLVFSGSGSPSGHMGGGPSSSMGGASPSQIGRESSSSMGESSRHSVGDSGIANQKGPAITHGVGSVGNGSVDVLVQNWRGVATKGDESYPVRVKVETIWTVNPNEARRLLASNMSLEDMRSLARAGERDMALGGDIRLNNDSYRLMDITLESSVNGSTLEASLSNQSSGSGQEDTASIVGRASLTISAVGDVNAAEGYLVIDDSKYSGTYSLFLNEFAGQGPRAGRLSQG